MIQALKLGLPYSISLSFSAAKICRIPKFNGPFSLSLRMAPKRHHSGTLASAAENSGEKRSIHEPKLRENASKASGEKNAIVEDEPAVFEKMALQEIKSSLRSSGISGEGSQDELISALRTSMNGKPDGEVSPAVQNEASLKEKLVIAKRTSKRKAKGLSEDEPVEVTTKVQDNSGSQRTKMEVKQSSRDSVDITFSQSATEQELLVESKGKKSTQAKKKVSSRMTTTKAKANASINLSVDEPWAVLTHMKPQKGWVGYNPKTMRPPPISADKPHIKLLSWNVNGLRALLKLESFSALQLAQREDFDVLCLQETKLQEKDVEAIRETLLQGYDNSYWTCSVSKLGYSGTAIISRN